MSYPPPYSRLTNFFQTVQAGGVFDQSHASELDAEYNNIAAALSAVAAVLQGITTANGALTNIGATTAMSLAGYSRVLATVAGQTVYTTTITWDSSMSVNSVVVEYVSASTPTMGSTVSAQKYTVANSGGFLAVTLTSGSFVQIGDALEIRAYTPGAGVLARLALTTNGDGASLVGIEDPGGLYAATTVEGALAEFKTAYNAFVTNVGATADLFKRTGAVAATGDFAMGAHKITGMADGVANTDAVTVQQLNAATQGLLSLTSYFLRKDVAVVWQSDQDAGSHKLANLVMTDTLGATAAEAANKNYVTGYVAAQLATINSQLASLGDPSAVGKRVITFTTPGSGTGYSWTVPTGVTAAIVELWGAGAGGASTTVGGGGAYIQLSLTLVAGDVVAFAVGAAGSPGQATVVYINGSQVASAGGGTRGNPTGAGGTPTINASPKISGSFGINGQTGAIGVGFTKGGDSPRGGSGTAQSDTAGTSPGGGGNGLGAGGNGWAIITY